MRSFRGTGAALTALVRRCLARAGRALLRPYGRLKGFAVKIKRRVGGSWAFHPALCAPGPCRSRAGSRLTQVLVLGTALMASAVSPSTVRAVPAGTLITNTARADYSLGGSAQTSFSNTVNITTVMIGSPSVLELFRYSPSSPSVFLTVGPTPYFDGGGFWLYYRLLEAGTFEEWKSPDASNHLTIDATELSMLLSGVSLVASRRRRKRYSQNPPEQAA